MKKTNIISKVLVLLLILVTIAFTFPKIVSDIKYGLDLQGGFEVLYKVESIDGKELTNSMVSNTYKAMLKRIDALGVNEPNIEIEGNNIRVQLAGITNAEQARTMLSATASLTFRDTSDKLLMDSSVLKSGGAKVSTNEYGKYVVSLSIKDKDTFYKVTKKISESQDKTIVIWLDFEENINSYSKEKNYCGSEASKCLSAATVPQAFASDVIIQGNFKEEEVATLVDLINSGSLPTKLSEISSKTVDASFGQDSLSKTYKAGIIGVALIAILMIIIYRFAGVISSIGIIIYTFLTFFIFWLIGGVLTLPGIAALVIGIGMAVDACVISFSRIKDELKTGKNLERAFKVGNKNALSSIIDSNITTLIVAIILFMFGESSVKGFSIMLTISIFTTVFVMVYVMRILLKIFVETGWFNNKLGLFMGYKKIKSESKFDFVGKRLIYYAVISLIVIVGISSLFINGLNLGIDFKGGSSITMITDEKINFQDVKTTIEELKYNIYTSEELENNTYNLKIKETLDEKQVYELQEKLTSTYKSKTDIGVISNEVKKDLIINAITSLFLASIGIIIYISLRFRFSYAISGILALIIDVFSVIAVFSLFKLEVTTTFIAAILSIIGYSINDKIVAFDRIRENSHGKVKNKNDLKEVVNKSIRQTFWRSIITTITTLFPILALIILGSRDIINFNIALLTGLTIGVLSSIFFATQIWYDLEKNKAGLKPKKKWYEE